MIHHKVCMVSLGQAHQNTATLYYDLSNSQPKQLIHNIINKDITKNTLKHMYIMTGCLDWIL